VWVETIQTAIVCLVVGIVQMRMGVDRLDVGVLLRDVILGLVVRGIRPLEESVKVRTFASSQGGQLDPGSWSILRSSYSAWIL
jgi:hypothetical protein